MRYLVLADVHSNLEALEACIEDAQKHDYGRILCLGDIVGYNANPNECIELLRKNEAICLMGNHDAACAGKLSYDWFNPFARQCIEWTIKELSGKNKRFLASLPVFFSCKWLFAVHGTPNNPIEEYMDEKKAMAAMRTVFENVVLCAHNHVPFKVEQNAKLVPLPGNKKIKLNKRIVVSMPAVGQPRDFDPRAGYGILDFEKKTLQIIRISYDLEKAASKVKSAGLPEFISERLKKGT